MAQEEQLIVNAPGGRVLDVLVAGPPGGLPLVFHTGTPSGLVAFGPAADAASERGLRTVLYARPGYSGSTPQPGRRVADAADDVAAILAQLDADEFLTVGWSGGGPAPYDSPGLDWLAGMADENAAEFGAALAGEAELTSFLGDAARALGGVRAGDVAESLGGLLSGADKAALTLEFAGYLAAALRAALGNGIAGWRDDDLAFTREWGISLETLGHATPVTIWQGGQDRMVPAAHGNWLAANIPPAHTRMRPDEGHLSLMANGFGAILDDLMGLARVSQPPGSRPG